MTIADFKCNLACISQVLDDYEGNNAGIYLAALVLRQSIDEMEKSMREKISTISLKNITHV